MAGKGDGTGTASENRLGNSISCIKYTLLCFNAICWIVGAGLFGLAMWMKLEPGFADWIERLDIEEFYAGIYVLICGAVIIMIVSFVGCWSSLMENTRLLAVFIFTQVLCFIFGLVGSAVLMDYSTYDSEIQPLIRKAMQRLIVDSSSTASVETLSMIQESIGCCGADGPNDYINLYKPLPTECRDTVTGNAFFYGCVDELTWFFEDKSAWLTGLALTLCFINVINTVLSTILIQALNKEQEELEGTFAR
ncbi:tetraspanin-2A [Anabrus simplex]|uniref:tetraspanin-2A n=1 Tax=Anabrus simplex TaxID=316456 RepID=UPI0034DDB8BF